jgi:uncharacterized membrane protein
MLLDIGLTPGVAALILLFLLGAGGVFALGAAAIAILVLGPRRWDAMTLPAAAAFVACVGYILLGGGSVSPIPSAIIATLLVAFVVAWLQRDSLEGRDPRAVRAARAIRIVGSVLVWLLAGLAVGLVIGAATQSAIPLLIFPLIGLLLGLRPAVVLERRSGRAADPGTPTPEETPPSAGILDE